MVFHYHQDRPSHPLVWILSLILFLSVLAGCAPSPVVNQTLVLSQISDPDSFNAYLSSDQATQQIISYTLCGLTTLDEETLQPKPELADWEVLDDGLRYIFTLQPDLYWSDGEPLTAADVDFTFNRIIFNEQIPTSSRDVQRIGEAQTLPQVRMLNETQVEFTLPEPFAPFLIQAGSPIMPRHLLEPTIEDTDAEGQPRFLQAWGIDTPVEQLISCGPYIIDAYSPNQRVLYRTNPYYWEQGEDGATLPRIPQAVRTIIDSQDTELIKFRSGELDAYTVRGVDFRLLKREEDQRAFTIYNLGPTLSNNFITLNQSQARNPNTGEPFVDPVKGRWFRSLNFRRALAHAIDQQGLVDSVLQGLGQPQDYTISPASPFHLPPGEGVPVYEYNPEKARDLLLQAGFSYREDGRLLDADGNLVRFTLHTNAGNNEREATGSLIKTYLDEIGITMDFVPIAFNSLVEKISQTRDWDAVMLSFGGGGVEPNNGANVWRSTGRLHLWNLGSQPGSEAEGVVVTEWEEQIDHIFSEGTRILDFAERKALYDRFQVIAQEQLPLINTYNPLELVALRDRLQGVDPRPILGSLWNYQELTIED